MRRLSPLNLHSWLVGLLVVMALVTKLRQIINFGSVNTLSTSKLHKSNSAMGKSSAPAYFFTAMQAYASTMTLVILDAHPGTSTTLDTLAFSSTTSFRGIKFINDHGTTPFKSD